MQNYQKNQQALPEEPENLLEEAPAPGSAKPAQQDFESDDYSEDDPELKLSLLEKNQDYQQPAQPQLDQGLQVNYAPSAIDEIEELVESVVEEKWRTLMESFGNVNIWKERTRIDISSLKQELIRLENRFENLQKAILGRIQTYDKNIMEVGSEIKAMEQVFQKILNPLTSNIKELSRITDSLKKKTEK